MRARDGDEPAEECVCRFVLNQVMGQNPGRFVGIDLITTSRTQVPDHPPERRSLPDKPASACPLYEIDMDVGRDDAGCRPARSPRPQARYSAKATRGKERQKTTIKAVPRRHQYRESANFKKRR